MKKLAVLFALSTAVFAQQLPPKAKPLSEVSSYKLLAAFEHAQSLQIRVQQQAMDLCKAEPKCSALWTEYQSSVSETNKAAAEVQAAEKLKPGTEFQVDTTARKVTYAEPPTPPPAPVAKPEPPK